MILRWCAQLPIGFYESTRVGYRGRGKEWSFVREHCPGNSRHPSVLRVLDSLQLTAAHKVATPVNWKPGDDVIIAGSVSDEDAKKQYPLGWKAPRPYIRIVPQPMTE